MRRWIIVYALWLMVGLIVYALWPASPKPSFVYHYQWPALWSNQKMTLCLGPAGDAGSCPRDTISSEL